MVNHVEAVTDIGGSQNMQLSVHDLAAQTMDENIRAENLSSLVQEALSHTVSRPNAATPLDAARADLAGPAEGAYADLKEGLISDVDRTSAEAQTDLEDTENVQAMTEERVQALYYDLTNYQIAWKIAQRMQQDITQLMRG